MNQKQDETPKAGYAAATPSGLRWVKASDRLGEFLPSDIPEWLFFHPGFCKVDGKPAERPFFRKDTVTGQTVFSYIYITGSNFSKEIPENEFNRIEWLDESAPSPSIEAGLPVNSFHATCPKCGENIDVIPPDNTVIKSEEIQQTPMGQKLWDLFSTLIPEDAYGGAEEIAEMTAGKNIMYESDFYKALASSDVYKILTPTPEWQDKFENWVVASWPENNNESAGCRGAARYAIEWMVDNVIKNKL